MGGKTFKIQLVGYNFQPFFKGQLGEGPCHEFFYFTDNADLHALRYDDWKVSFKTIDGNLFTGKVLESNVPVVDNLRQDPFERYLPEAAGDAHWWGEKLWILIPAVAITGQYLET